MASKKSKKRKCSYCHKPGHFKPQCPVYGEDLDFELSEWSKNIAASMKGLAEDLENIEEKD